MPPHGSLHAVLGVSPCPIGLGWSQGPIQPHDDVIVNHPALLEFGNPGIPDCLGAGAAVVPLAEGVQEPADVLGAPIAVAACIGQGQHPDSLVFAACVVQLLCSDTKGFPEARYTRLCGVDFDAVGSPINNSGTTPASC